MLPFQKIDNQNYKKSSLEVFIGCLDFSELTGMPMYVFRLSRGLLERGAKVTVVSPTVGGTMLKLAEECGIECIQDDNDTYKDKDFDVLLLNETISEKYLKDFPDVPAYNFCHSKQEADRPIEKIPQIRGYIAPRRQVANYWKKKTGYKFDIIPIPIDFEKYQKPKPRVPNYQTRILCVCTFNGIRGGMIRDLIDSARNDGALHVRFVGKDYGVMERIRAERPLPNNVDIFPPTEYPEKHIEWADQTASLYVGTTCLESWACDKPCRVYQDNNKWVLRHKPDNFEEKHSIDSVVDKFLELFNRKWADIIIPHHDRADMLRQCLESIPLRNFNVIIRRGGSFSENCNIAAGAAKADRIIFVNDDMVLNPDALWKLCDVDLKEYAVGTVRQVYPDGNPICVGITIDEYFRYALTNDIEKATYPSGGIFVISKKLFNKFKFDENFKNGGEDQDLFLRLLEEGHKFQYLNASVVHYLSQSEGRFDFNEQNDDYFFSVWTEGRLKKLLC